MKTGKDRNTVMYMMVCAAAVCVAVILLSAVHETYIPYGGNESYQNMGILFSLNYPACGNRDNSDADKYDIAEYALKSHSEISSVVGMEELSDDCYYAEIIHDASYSDDEVISILENDGIFGIVEADGELCSDAFGNMKTDIYMKDQWYLESIEAPSGWALLDGAPGEGAVVAVIDTGVNYKHTDIKNNMWINKSEYYGVQGVDDDGNGVVDDIYGADFVDSDGDPMDNDESFHGSHVAGIIAMTADNGGGRGIAFGTKIMALKAGNSEGAFKVSNVIRAINYAIDMGADVINMSFGTCTESVVMRAVLENASKKCVLVAAAGNESAPNSEGEGENAKSVYPASYPFVIGVMAQDSSGALTHWSNYDASPFTMDEYEIAAPGYNMLSISSGNKYAYMSGTSMAAPVVSAAAAVLCSTVDRTAISDPVKHVFGQITRSGSHNAVKTLGNGKNISYKSLNLFDALKTETGVDIEIGNIHFSDLSGDIEFKDSCTFDSEGRKELYCGFVVDNTWGGAKGVCVNITSGSEAFEIDNSTVVIGDMDACQKIEIGREHYESVKVIFNGEMNKTYTVPVRFEITRVVDGNDEVVTERIIETSLTLNVYNGAVQDESQAVGNPDGAAEAGTESESAAPTIPLVVPGGSYIDVSWDNLLGAEGYYVYRSVREASGYKQIAGVKVSKGLSYRDKNIKKGVVYYYKIKAYYSDRTQSALSDRGYGIVLRKVKGVSCTGDSQGMGTKVTLKWKKSPGADGYVIYYSAKKSGGYKKLAMTDNVKYTYKYKGRKTCYYRIKAYGEGSSGRTYSKYSQKVKAQK